MRDRSVYVRLLIKTSAFVVIVVLAALFLRPLLNMFAPFFVALLLAWILNPLVMLAVRKLKLGHGLASTLCVAAVFIIIGGFLGWIIKIVLTELTSFAGNWESIWRNVNSSIDALFGGGVVIIKDLPASVNIRLEGVLDMLSEGLYKAVNSATSSLDKVLGNYAKSLPAVLLFSLAFIIGSFVISFKFPKYRTWFYDKTAHDSAHPLNSLKTIIKSAFGGYLRATLIIAGIVGIVTLVAFLIMGVKYAVLLGILMGILDILPYVGAGLVVLPWALISIFTGYYLNAVILLITYAAILLIRNFFLPKVLGSQAGVSPLVSLIGVFLGFKVGGVWGMIWGPIVVIILVGIFKSGIFSGTVADIRAVARDIRIKLSDTG